MRSSPLRTLVVSGPTASGKSALGISLARSLSGEVVNIDSVQVYRGLDIGSAKVTDQERSLVPHHLLDISGPNEQMNAGEYRERALVSISDISARGNLPVLVGGTTMYLTVLLQGIVELPSTPAEIRESVAKLAKVAQYKELSRIDPVTAARLHPNDSQRVSRALEVARITGRKPSELHAEHAFNSKDLVALVVIVCRERGDLYARIDARAREMVRRGLVAETREIMDRFGSVPALGTLGYKQAVQFLQGELPADRLADEIALHTRRFAKRQMTYLRNEPLKRGWVVRPGDGDDADVVEVGGGEGAKAFRTFALSEGELIERVRQRLALPLERTEVWYVSVC